MFSNVTLTDYEGSLKIFFFGQDYINYGKYCKKGLFLLVRGKVQPRFRRQDNGPEMLEFKVSNMELLQEVRKTKVKSLAVDIPLQVLTEQFVAELIHQCEHSKGNTQLEFNIIDPETKTSIHLFSRNVRIDPADEFLDYLRSKEGILFKIN